MLASYVYSSREYCTWSNSCMNAFERKNGALMQCLLQSNKENIWSCGVLEAILASHISWCIIEVSMYIMVHVYAWSVVHPTPVKCILSTDSKGFNRRFSLSYVFLMFMKVLDRYCRQTTLHRHGGSDYMEISCNGKTFS
jgi:hypothetical protein